MASMERWEIMRRLNDADGYMPEDLTGVAELAHNVFHVPRTVVTSWNARRDRIKFPTPVLDLRCGPVFSISEYVVAWYDWNPKRGNKSGTLDETMREMLSLWLQQIKESEHGI